LPKLKSINGQFNPHFFI
jgi:hypothetical protein